MRVVAVFLAGSLLFNPALVQSSDFGQKANDEEKYSVSLVVAPSAKATKYLKYQDGRQQVIYSMSAYLGHASIDSAEAYLAVMPERFARQISCLLPASGRRTHVASH